MRHQCNFFGVLKYINNRQLYEFIHRHYLFLEVISLLGTNFAKELLVTSNFQGQINYDIFPNQMVSSELIINQIVCRRQENLFAASKLLQHGKCWMLYHLQFTLVFVVTIVGCMSLYMQKMELWYEWEYSNDKTRINWLNEKGLLILWWLRVPIWKIIFFSKVLLPSELPRCRERQQTAICCLEWLGGFKCLMTGCVLVVSFYIAKEFLKLVT